MPSHDHWRSGCWIMAEACQSMNTCANPGGISSRNGSGPASPRPPSPPPALPAENSTLNRSIQPSPPALEQGPRLPRCPNVLAECVEVPECAVGTDHPWLIFNSHLIESANPLHQKKQLRRYGQS